MIHCNTVRMGFLTLVSPAEIVRVARREGVLNTANMECDRYTNKVIRRVLICYSLAEVDRPPFLLCFGGVMCRYGIDAFF